MSTIRLFHHTILLYLDASKWVPKGLRILSHASRERLPKESGAHHIYARGHIYIYSYAYTSHCFMVKGSMLGRIYHQSESYTHGIDGTPWITLDSLIFHRYEWTGPLDRRLNFFLNLWGVDEGVRPLEVWVDPKLDIWAHPRWLFPSPVPLSMGSIKLLLTITWWEVYAQEHSHIYSCICVYVCMYVWGVLENAPFLQRIR